MLGVILSISVIYGKFEVPYNVRKIYIKYSKLLFIICKRIFNSGFIFLIIFPKTFFTFSIYYVTFSI